MKTTHRRLESDLYQLTMAAAHLKAGTADREAVFALYFRKAPFGGPWVIAAGLEDAVRWLEGFEVGEDDLAWLAGVVGPSGARLFDDATLDALAKLRFVCDVDAVPEGTIVFPNEPLLRVRGPLLQAQLFETALLALVNFPTLVATKAARVVEAAAGRPVLEFGLRRAQGLEAGRIAARAAWIGGVSATSNVAAARTFGIPARGTHAHSWVLALGDEATAFDAFARVFPDDTTLLVDTHDTRTGVRNAIETARKLRARGHELAGIRLDSGDLLALSRAARAMLDDAGFPRVTIVASNDLDEHAIAKLVAAGAPIDAFGVGTRLVTGAPDAALGGVYKLTAIREGAGWRDCIKVSDDRAKATLPGTLQVQRERGANGTFRRDLIYDEYVDRPRWGSKLLEPIFRKGRRVWQAPSLDAIREHAREQIASFPKDRIHPVTIEEVLLARRDGPGEETSCRT